MSTNHDVRPLIAHVIYRLGVGGLENGVVNLLNRMPESAFRHVIICVKDSTDFSGRLQRKDIEIYPLNKKEGHDWMSFVKMFRLLRRLKPDIVHTRNLATIEYQLPAWLAGVRNRIHGEHGWDVFDPEGNNRTYRKLRKLLSVIIHRFIPLSEQLQDYLQNKVGISAAKVTRICNGVDVEKFYPSDDKSPLVGCPFSFAERYIYVGTIGRMHGVKDQMTLVKSFVHLLEQRPELAQALRLMLVGDGPIRDQALTYLTEKRRIDLAWLPGERNDVAEILRNLDVFVLPSLAEGISNTILEAMASGLPVVATCVGGNPELVVEGVTGGLVEKGDYRAMADKIGEYVDDFDLRRLHGNNGRQRVLEEFSLTGMVDRYVAVYNSFPLNRPCTK